MEQVAAGKKMISLLLFDHSCAKIRAKYGKSKSNSKCAKSDRSESSGEWIGTSRSANSSTSSGNVDDTRESSGETAGVTSGAGGFCEADY